jgi:hypothetical protein
MNSLGFIHLRGEFFFSFDVRQECMHGKERERHMETWMDGWICVAFFSSEYDTTSRLLRARLRVLHLNLFTNNFVPLCLCK